jgi:hypothetical protein
VGDIPYVIALGELAIDNWCAVHERDNDPATREAIIMRRLRKLEQSPHSLSPYGMAFTWPSSSSPTVAPLLGRGRVTGKTLVTPLRYWGAVATVTPAIRAQMQSRSLGAAVALMSSVRIPAERWARVRPLACQLLTPSLVPTYTPSGKTM